ncbi:T9SS type A sorting domain-containing protein [Hymenobacter sp. UYCo722]|uniref:T9SS type A sorting domain-containing protein n=1 Tax=Hymenobacter sp. UYCo722 TaxID=3156335 RepID=UPI003398B526
MLPFAAHAQFNYALSNAANVAGTYTDLGTTGAAIATANTDDANSAAQPIGFTFNYSGTAFTQFVLNTNGFIKLGATAPSATDLFLPESQTATQIDPFESTNPADINILAPFNFDLTAGSAMGGTEYRLTTSGTAPDRVCTIQWKNVADKTMSKDQQYGSMNFQVKLYETSNTIEFVYGTAVQGTLPDVFRLAVVGIKGTGINSGQSLVVTKASSEAWGAATFLDGFYTANGHNFRGTIRPDAGRTYRFGATVVSANDAAVKAVYTLGTVSSIYSSPVVVQALISNPGTNTQTNLPVTLTVSGATTYTNTQTIATLAPGASTTLTYSVPIAATTGTNTVLVTVPADDANSNNTKTATQTVTSSALSHFPAGTTAYTSGIGSNNTANVLLFVRYRANAGSAIQTIKPTFLNVSGSTYQVLIYGANATTSQPGTLLYTSPTLTQPKNDGAVSVAVPNVPVNGDFFVAVKQLGTTNIGLAFLTDNPLRPATFYFSSDGVAFTDLATASFAPKLAIDVTLATATATRNEALAAAVSVAPNPAHQRFTLSVPAGGLRAATATLANTLGQTVQTRQLSLPAAGGTADFDVSRLAAGIYTLTLQAGNDLVVKRVVVE